MAKSIVIPLTDAQFFAIKPTLEKVKDGEALIAQVYSDGIRLKHLTKIEARAIGAILGASGKTARTAKEANS